MATTNPPSTVKVTIGQIIEMMKEENEKFKMIKDILNNYKLISSLNQNCYLCKDFRH